MAISVKDCLHIGILEQAKVIAGASGLMRPVESVTVIEFNGFKRPQFSNLLSGNELAVTAFSCMQDATESEWITFFNSVLKSGISCIVVFYYGTFISEIPSCVLEIANRKALPIILLPPELNYPYTDIILPICEAVLNDKRAASKDSAFFTDILNEILGLDKRAQNIQALLSTLSQRTQYNLILTDTNFSPFAWTLPSLKVNVPVFLDGFYASIGRTLPLTPQTITYPIDNQQYQIRFQPLRTNKLIGALLILQEKGANISIDISNQIADVISLSLQLWRLSRGQLTELELRLNGDIQNVQPKKYEKIIVIGHRDGLPLKINDLQFDRLDYNAVLPNAGWMERAIFKGNIVLAGFKDDIDCQKVLEFSRQILSNTPDLCLGELSLNGQSLRDACHTIIDVFPTASMVFPMLDVFSADQISFAEEINSLKNTLGKKLASFSNILLPLKEQRDWEKLFLTLAVTYLDCNGSASMAAEILHVHANTIKYRISCARDILGISFDVPLNYSRLIIALAVERLLR